MAEFGQHPVSFASTSGECGRGSYSPRGHRVHRRWWFFSGRRVATKRVWTVAGVLHLATADPGDGQARDAVHPPPPHVEKWRSRKRHRFTTRRWSHRGWVASRAEDHFSGRTLWSRALRWNANAPHWFSSGAWCPSRWKRPPHQRLLCRPSSGLVVVRPQDSSFRRVDLMTPAVELERAGDDLVGTLRSGRCPCSSTMVEFWAVPNSRPEFVRLSVHRSLSAWPCSRCVSPPPGSLGKELTCNGPLVGGGMFVAPQTEQRRKGFVRQPMPTPAHAWHGS